MDPLTKSYPMLTPYQFASNSPIDGIDLDGLEYVRSVGDPAQDNMTARDQSAPYNIIDIRKFGEPKIKNQHTQPTIRVPDKEKLDQISRDRAIFVLNNVVADPQKLRDGDLVEWLAVVPVGKGFKYLNKTTNIIDGTSDIFKIWKSVSEPVSFTKSLEKVYGKKAVENYEKIIKPQLAKGELGGNVHELTGELKGWKAIDIPGSGKGRGGGRIVFREIDEIIEIKGFVKEHNYKNVIE